MTTITLNVTVDETVDVAQLGTWLEAWIQDQWDGHGEPFPTRGVHPKPPIYVDLHLRSVKAVPPASSRKGCEHKAMKASRHFTSCGDCGAVFA